MSTFFAQVQNFEEQKQKPTSDTSVQNQKANKQSNMQKKIWPKCIKNKEKTVKNTKKDHLLF